MSVPHATVRCPGCAVEAAPRALHAHLAEDHADWVSFEERRGGNFYRVECPLCQASYEHQIKPRLQDPRFVEEFRREIRLVALDMLLNHLLAEHEEPEPRDGLPDGDGTGDEGA